MLIKDAKNGCKDASLLTYLCQMFLFLLCLRGLLGEEDHGQEPGVLPLPQVLFFKNASIHPLSYGTGQKQVPNHHHLTHGIYRVLLVAACLPDLLRGRSLAEEGCRRSCRSSSHAPSGLGHIYI